MAGRGAKKGTSIGILAAAVLLGAAGSRESPAPLHLESRVEGRWIAVRAWIGGGPASDAQRMEVIEALRRGLRSEIVLQFRVYEPAQGLEALFGDRLLAEATISRTARWDPFARVYVMDEKLDGELREPLSRSDAVELLESFFGTEVERLLEAPPSLARGAYVAARYRLSPVRVDGTLRIVTLVLGFGLRTSEWTRGSLGGTP